jgi:hypothetical protein
MFENRVLRIILGPKRDEIPGQWRGLHNEELYDLYSSPHIVRVIKSRRMKLVGHVARLGDRRGAYRVLVETPDGKRSFGMPRSRCKDRVIVDLQEVGWGDIDWIELAEDWHRWRALVYAVINLRAL